jgi:tetratricopeptide (TPR) repeat protein
MRNEIMAAWMERRWRTGGLVAACLAVYGATALAAPTIESLPLAAAYGSGVHSYFAGDYQRAYDELSQAIEGGTIDPRAWYYRGLTALKLGRTDEAEADFSAGASREAEGTGAWPVAKSLERVQGCDRLKLERHRSRARVAQIQEDRRRGQLRYLDVERATPEVLRSRRPIVDRRVDEANPFEGRVEDVPAPANTDAPQPGWKPRTEEMPEPAAEPAPASDDPFAPSANSRQDARDELRASSRGNVAEQTDGRLEREATEFENTLEQRDAQQEFEAAR